MESMIEVLKMLIMGAAVYGGIRADIKNMKGDMGYLRGRLDNHIENHK